VAGWVYQWVWALIFGAVPLVIVLFPNGALLSRAWRLVPGLLALAGLLMVPVTVVMW
jgi:hypothetical protein